MGLFTWVKIPDGLLPDEAKGLEGWQTKDVVDPWDETLEITTDGELYYVWHDWEWVEDEASFFGGWLRPVDDHRDRLGFHGDMEIYTGRGDELIEVMVRFTHGKFERAWVREIIDLPRTARSISGDFRFTEK
jgi:hypothetical protein